MDWRQPHDYRFCDDLDLSGWAWQFLRRNPEYQADHAWFIATWRALEADYGAPPRRDFFRWKQDPRAWRAEAELAGCSGDLCPGENDQVLIECWMGAKWGLRQFPPDPAVCQPEGLAWREQPVVLEPLGTAEFHVLQQSPGRIALGFDLALPLGPQLEAARVRLLAARHALAKAGRLPATSLQAGAPVWRAWLRLLDGLGQGAALDEIARVLDLADADGAREQARDMVAGGYRRILMLENQAHSREPD